MHSTLIASPKRWSSWDFIVTAGSSPVAQIESAWWAEKGVLTIEGVPYRVYREGMMSGDFIIESAGSVLARAEKPSAMRRAFTIRHDGRSYTLRAKATFGRTFLLLAGDREVGSLSPQGLFTRRAAVNLPEELPLPLRMFVLWLAIVLWKRDAGAAAA